jgi:PAS domain S-box-containing protein
VPSTSLPTAWCCTATLTRADARTITGSSLLGYFAERDRTRIVRALRESRANAGRFRAHLLTVDGALVPVNVAAHIMADDGVIRSIVIVTSDLTQVAAAQEATTRINQRLEQANRALHMLNLCNTIIIHATDETQLLIDTCRALVDAGGYRLAWIGYAEHDEAKSVRPVAWADSAAGEVESAGVSWGDDERGRGPTGAAIRTGRMAILRDADTNEAFGPWREIALREGYRSCGSAPLSADGDVLGALTLFSGQPNAFDDQELALLTELADDISYGIANLRREKQLQSTANFTRSLLETSLDPLVTIDPAGKITDVNEATVWATGIPRELLIGTDFCDFFTDPQQARCGYQEAFEKGSITDFPLTIRHKDGRLTDVLYNAAKYRDSYGDVRGVFAAARDITESRRVALRLAETRVLLDNILQSSTKYSIIGEDLDRKILYWNEGARRSYGYTAEEIVGKSQDILQTPEDGASGAIDRLFATATTKGLAEADFQRVRKDGTRFPGNVVVTRRDDSSGNPIGYLVISNDISEKQLAEEQLRSASQYARSLIEASLDPLATISPDGKITDVNHATQLITGRTRESLIGTDFAIHFTEPEKARAGYRAVFTKGFVIDYPLAIRHVSGTVTEVVFNASLYRDANGMVAGVFAAARDISRLPKSDATAASRRRARFWRNVSYAVAAVVVFVGVSAVSIGVGNWLEQQREQAGIVRTVATNARMRSLLAEVNPGAARVCVGTLQNHQGISVMASFTMTYGIAAPGHALGIMGKALPVSVYSDELDTLSADNCAHDRQQRYDDILMASDVIVCPIIGRARQMLGFLFLSWDRGDPVPDNFDPAMAATKQAATDIARIWTGDRR